MNYLYSSDQNKSAIKQIHPTPKGTQCAVADSRALQEIIDILKEPFMTSCDTCNGLGFVKSGQNCQICAGSGRVIDTCFK